MTAHRRLCTLAASLLLSGLAGGTSIASASGPAPGDRAPEPRTRVTMHVDGCEGCTLQLTQTRTVKGDVRTWQSEERTVRDTTAHFTFATRRTRGMSVAVTAPWEGNTGYRTLVAWRYNAEAPGQTVTLEQAVTKRRAAPCWVGTRAQRIDIPLVVEEVEVEGLDGPTPGLIAFAAETQRWLGATRRADHGVLGAQDAPVCR